MKQSSPLQQIHPLRSLQETGHTRNHSCSQNINNQEGRNFNQNYSCLSEINSHMVDSPYSESDMPVSQLKYSASLYQRLPDYFKDAQSIKKQHSFPTMHNETPEGKIFDLSCSKSTTSTFFLPVNVNSTKPFTTEILPLNMNPIDQNTSLITTLNGHLEFETVPVNTNNVSEPREKFKKDVDKNQKQNRRVIYTQQSPIRSQKNKSSDAKSLDIVGNCDQRITSINNTHFRVKNDLATSKISEDFCNYSESGTRLGGLYGIKHRSESAPTIDAGVIKSFNDIPQGIHGRDTTDSRFTSCRPELQICSMVPVNMTQQSLSEPKLRPQSSVSSPTSGKNRRHRQIELEQVHQVYTKIAPYCGHVKQKAWPRVKKFLKEMEPGSLVADVGCGNGKYLNINTSVFKLGSDTCPPFLHQGRSQGHEVMLADNLALPYRNAAFDAVISIGVIHHFASLERRARAISELSRVLSPGGRLMVYVWAFEQVHRKFESQDVLIPWVKPEIRDNSARNTQSRVALSESSTNGYSADFISLTSQVASTETLHGDQKHYDNNSKAVLERDRSNFSDNDGSPAENSVVIQKFGVFDRRDSPKREYQAIRNGSYESRNTNFDDTSSYEDQATDSIGLSDGAVKMILKWPGNLVSECSKFKKILRSFSSQSDSQINGDDESDVVDKVTGDNNDCDEKSLKLEETNDKLIENSHNKVTLNQPLENDQDNIAQDKFNGCCVNHIQATQETQPVAISDQKMTGISCGSSDNKLQFPTATAYHNVPATSTFNAYFPRIHPPDSKNLTIHESPLSTININQSGINVGGIRILQDNYKSGATYNSSDELLEMPHGNKDGKISSCPDNTECSSDGGRKPPLDSWVTMSTSESSINTDFNSSNLDKTVTEDHDKSKKTVYGINNQSLPGKSQKGNMKLGNIGEAESPLGQNILVPKCSVSRDVVDQMNFWGEGTSGLSRCQQHLLNHHTNIKGDLNNPGRSRSNTSTEVNYGESNHDDNTDCLDTDSVFSEDKDKSYKAFNDQRQDRGIFTGMSTKTNLRQGNVSEVTTDISSGVNKNEEFWLGQVMEDEQQPSDNENTNKNYRGATSSQERAPLRTSFKSIFHKLANYFHKSPKSESKHSDDHPNGRDSSDNNQLEVGSSNDETPESNFSSHSSCYPGLFASARDRSSSEKRDSHKTVKSKTENNFDDFEFEVINDPPTVKADDINASRQERQYCEPTINTLEKKQDFVSDLLESVPPGMETPQSLTKPFYLFKVDKPVPIKKESFFHALTNKWSGLFNKDSKISQRRACLQYSSVSYTSSDEDEEALSKSPLTKEIENTSVYTTARKMYTERPNSLDFTKKRTRRKGKRPAPRKENIDNKAEDRPSQSQNNGQLTLSEAMTLLGDGATEESVIKRLDDSAKSIFTEMRRMNFAIRKFPMSSLDSDNSEDVIAEDTGTLLNTHTATPPDKDPQIQPDPLKLRKEKGLLDSHRRFSDSATAQAILQRRRAPLQRQKDVDTTSSVKKVHLLQKEYLSEDLANFFDSFGIQRCKRESHLYMPNCKSDLFTPLESTSGSQKTSYRSQNRSNNAQSTESTTNILNTSDSFYSEMPCEVNHYSADSEGISAPQTINDVNDSYDRQPTLEYANEFNDNNIINVHDNIRQSDTSASINQSYLQYKDSLTSHKESSLNTHSQSDSETPLPDFIKQSQVTVTTTNDNSLCRYYHVFKEGELDDLIINHVPSLKIIDTFHDHANWCIIAEKL